MAKPDDPGSQGRSNAPGQQDGGAPGKSGEEGRGHSPEKEAEREERRKRGEPDEPVPGGEGEGETPPSTPSH